METFKQQLEVGQAGDQLGALVRGVKREDVRRGMVLCPPSSVTSHTQLKGQVWRGRGRGSEREVRWGGGGSEREEVWEEERER